MLNKSEKKSINFARFAKKVLTEAFVCVIFIIER